ncbi:MAG: MarR family winged helix-turn-helix transcriptional regulator [Methanobacteriota archaeon]
MENFSRDFGVNDPLTLSEIHTIQAIGNNPDNNVKIIADTLGVTPSAASQVIKKLNRREFVRKIRGFRNEKEVTLELTEKGRIAYQNHELIHAHVQEQIISRIGDLNDGERNTIWKVFSAFDSVYNETLENIAKLQSVESGDESDE